MYLQGCIEPFWTNDYQSFNYVKQNVSKEEHDYWVARGYNENTSFSGVMYDSKNPMPDWVKRVGEQFNLKNQGHTIYCMRTLDIMPLHTDHFGRYQELFCSDITKIRRVLVFLEDWKSGHYFEIEDRAIVNWKAGDWYMWDYTTEHAASNIGVEPRYTLQVTGHV